MKQTITPNYIKSLLMPNGQKPAGRKVWSIDLETVWLPFFLATNLTGDTAISHEALGCPLRLGYAQDGSVRFGKNGRPQVKVVKELSDIIRVVRENFVATLTSHAGSVAESNPEGYTALVATCHEAGEPITNKDTEAMQEAVRQQIEQAMAEAASKVVVPERELVTA